MFYKRFYIHVQLKEIAIYVHNNYKHLKNYSKSNNCTITSYFYFKIKMFNKKNSQCNDSYNVSIENKYRIIKITNYLYTLIEIVIFINRLIEIIKIHK
jgi:hypothetical protein